jgi:hypothetical protein
MKRIYPVFVPPEHIKEDYMEHSEVIDWCYKNLKDSTSSELILNLEDLEILEKSQVLNILNDVIFGIVSEGENDWLISAEDKLEVLKRWESYYSTLDNGRVKELLQKLIKLLKKSITTNANMYFCF